MVVVALSVLRDTTDDKALPSAITYCMNQANINAERQRAKRSPESVVGESGMTGSAKFARVVKVALCATDGAVRIACCLCLNRGILSYGAGEE